MQDDERDDASLVTASARGDAEAFAALVRRHIRAATLLGFQLLGDQDDAEDIVQMAFTLVYQRVDTYDTGRPFTPWLYGIVRKLSANKVARDRRRERLLRLWGPQDDRAARVNTDAAERAIDAKDDVQVMQRVLQELPPMQRACFDLVVIRGISVEEAAAMHAISEATVRQHIFRARQTLSQALQKAP